MTRLCIQASMLMWLLIWWGPGQAQVDSLRQAAEALPAGEEKIMAWNDLAFYLYTRSPQEAITYAARAKAMANSRSLDLHVGKSQYMLAAALQELGQYPEALAQADSGIEIFHRLGDAFREAVCLNAKGVILRQMNLPQEAIQALLRSAEISETLGDSLSLALAYNNVGTLFHDLGDLESQAAYLQAAIALLKKLDAPGSLLNAYMNLALNQTDSLHKYNYLDSARQIGNRMADESLFLGLYGNFASYFLDREQLDSAAYYAARELRLAQEIGVIPNTLNALNAQASIALAQRKFPLAMEHLQAAIAQGEAAAYVDEELLESYELLANTYEQQGRYREALTWFQQARSMQDTLEDRRVNAAMRGNSLQYEMQSKARAIAEEQLKTSKARNQLYLTLFGAGSLLALIAVLAQVYTARQRRRKQEAERVMRDQQREAERLRELNDWKTSFFTNISHELRTPLTLVLSPLADLMMEANSVPLRQKLQLVQRNAKRMLSLINEIMDLSKVEVGQWQLHLSSVPLEPFVRRIYAAFESMAAMRSLSYELDLRLDWETARLDRDKVEKILHNLLSNALKYSPKGSSVFFQVSQQGETLIATVADTGQGIHPDDLPHVFDRFYQGRHGQAPLQGGTGVGLALSRELAVLMQGSLEAESVWGEGSRFVLTLPLEPGDELSVDTGTEEAISQEESATGFTPITIQGEKPRVLVVEDNPDMARYLLDILSDQYQCIWAKDGEEALAQLRIDRFEAILSDVMMPNLDGFGLRERLNAHAEWRLIPFVLLTARYLESDKLMGFRLGVDDYLTKPFSTAELKARLQVLVHNKRERDAHQQGQQGEASPEEAVMSQDEALIQQLEQIVLAHLEDEQFTVDQLAEAVHLSPKQLRRLIKEYTGLTTVSFVLEVRLQQARALLETRQVGTVFDAQVKVGIGSTSYFTRKFTERFGRNPSSLLSLEG